MINKNRQQDTPILSAIQAHRKREVVPFHVPGHKHGQGLQQLRELFGAAVFEMDLNSMADLDDLCNPISVIAESQDLAAQAFGADRAYYLMNGTTSGIHAMFLSAARPGETVILPRNCHKSAYSALILSGAIPVYAPVTINRELGITMTLSIDSLKETFLKTPHAEALFVVNPSYYGYTGDLKSMVRIAHTNNAIVMVDEAHGCHMSFHDQFPLTAMEAGAEMSASSAHKTAGAFTQSSFLLVRGNRVDYKALIESLDLLRTTSSSYLLMISLELARKQMALNGRELLGRTIQLANHARDVVNNIPGLYAFGKDLIKNGAYDFDETKLNIHVRRLGLTGYEMDRILREEHNIQIELADLSNIMAIVTVGDSEESMEKLLKALKKIASDHQEQDVSQAPSPPEMPTVIVTPRDAFYSEKKSVALEKSAGEICGEMVMSYPPGIPVICPGERISQEIVDYIKILKEEKCNFQGTYDSHVDYLRVLGI